MGIFRRYVWKSLIAILNGQFKVEDLGADMSHQEKVWRDAFESDYLFRLDGSLLLAMVAAKTEFDRYLQNQSDLRNYTIWFNISENKEFACISFLPNQGEDKHGRGYDLYYRLENTELLEVVEMR